MLGPQFIAQFLLGNNIQTTVGSNITSSAISGIPYEIDHIQPLRGCFAYGLHIPWNLQAITQQENQKKNNKLSV